jgi:hypothetical protein
MKDGNSEEGRMTGEEFVELRRRQRIRPAAHELNWGERRRNLWEGRVPALLALACGLAAVWIVGVVILSARMLGWL